MPLITEPYRLQQGRWPASGRHILAQFDDSTIVVYQAYKPAIGHFAARHGYFGGAFSFERMSWIKTNFLWMMYRSGWGTKIDQEVTLAIRLQRAAFDELLALAVPSSFDGQRFPDRAAWQDAVARSEVRQQWDPDHDPAGAKQQRRAIQLGLRGAVLARYARDWIVEIEDISGFVAEQRGRSIVDLITPREEVYPFGPASDS
ncbi:MAG: DUF4291 domain-containing protein [Gemmataceae bacterium]